jgi:adenosine deaminase
MFGDATMKLFRLGLFVSVNSDDPGVQNSSILDDYEMLRVWQSASEAEIIQLVKNGFSSSMLNVAKKEEWFQEVDRVSAEYGIF